MSRSSFVVWNNDLSRVCKPFGTLQCGKFSLNSANSAAAFSYLFVLLARSSPHEPCIHDQGLLIPGLSENTNTVYSVVYLLTNTFLALTSRGRKGWEKPKHKMARKQQAIATTLCEELQASNCVYKSWDWAWLKLQFFLKLFLLWFTILLYFLGRRLYELQVEWRWRLIVMRWDIVNSIGTKWMQRLYLSLCGLS